MTATRNRALILAFGLATAATYMTYQFLNTAGQLPMRAAPPARQVKVVVPVADVAPLRPLHTSMFTTRYMAADGLPRDVVADPRELEGQVSLATLRAGHPVGRTDISPRTAQLGMAFVVRPPRRAVTVALDPVIGVAGFPKPGNRVDVLASFTTNQGMVTRTILEDIEILALGADVARDKPSSADRPPATGAGEEGEVRVQPTATLAVLPAEAEKLILAETRGKLRLALRAVDDTTRRRPSGVSEVQLTGVPVVQKEKERSTPAPSPTPKPFPARLAVSPGQRKAPAPHKVLVVRGSSHEVVQVSGHSAPAEQPASVPPATPTVVEGPQPAPESSAKKADLTTEPAATTLAARPEGENR